MLARDAVALPGVSKPQSDVHLHLQSADRTTVFFEALPGRGKKGEEGVYLSSRNFLSAHEKVMKFFERQRERERDSGGV